MLLQVKHIGINEHSHRLYHIQTPTGLSGIVDLVGCDTEISVLLVGTYYRREYPAAGKLDDNTPPRIRDLEGGYNTLASFVACWEHSTEDQRADLCEHVDVRYFYASGKRKGQRNTREIHAEDRPRIIPARPIDTSADGTWYRLDPINLKAALKGIKSTVRIGTATIKTTILKQLCQHTKADLIELRDENGALGFRTVDVETRYMVDTIRHKTRCTIKHGAGDPYAGRNGWEARLTFVPA